MVIDPTTNLGKLRLRVGDFGDIPFLPDDVYYSTLTDCNENLPRATIIVAQYILAILTHKTHRKLNQLEVWSNEQYAQYLSFIKTTILNPHLSQLSPIPYTGSDTSASPLVEFVEDWNGNYSQGTQSEQLHNDSNGYTL